MKTLALVVSLAFLSGCKTYRTIISYSPIESTPPAQSITLKNEHRLVWITQPFVFPEGTYNPKMENEKGYFFEAPTKVKIFPYSRKGGIYWEKGLDEPIHFYTRNGELINIIRDESLPLSIHTIEKQ